MAIRTPPNIDFAAYAQEHLRYEARMFADARDRLLTRTLTGFDKMAAIEVAILHLRNLIEFFYPGGQPFEWEKDDVTA